MTGSHPPWSGPDSHRTMWLSFSSAIRLRYPPRGRLVAQKAPYAIWVDLGHIDSA